MSLLYTVMPLELVLQESSKDVVENYELSITGGSVIVEALSMDKAKIIRVISSDPQVYLQPQLQPGSVIEFSWHFGKKSS